MPTTTQCKVLLADCIQSYWDGIQFFVVVQRKTGQNKGLPRIGRTNLSYLEQQNLGFFLLFVLGVLCILPIYIYKSKI